ncbi:hypothetical protein GXW78_21860 [Roseomonas terrae]|jgi:hypothetical protein|uniref:DUF3035 domain-containing protein n=1 Tax=Neoroseomonas terrae TaxID=424799 RepID=A0ABS5EMR6_9PROT|nr:hypothetical protein [Neoroseomonas terrae]MBR0652318.1 hypothetical protein [Neoroseomonas terrae]
MALRYAPVATLALALGLGACAPDTYFPPTDFERAGTWQAEGINDRNLRAMVADPSNLTRGVGAATDRGAMGAAAAQALQDGRRPALPRTTLSEVGQDSGGGATGVTSGGRGGSGGN